MTKGIRISAVLCPLFCLIVGWRPSDRELNQSRVGPARFPFETVSGFAYHLNKGVAVLDVTVNPKNELSGLQLVHDLIGGFDEPVARHAILWGDWDASPVPLGQIFRFVTRREPGKAFIFFKDIYGKSNFGDESRRLTCVQESESDSCIDLTRMYSLRRNLRFAHEPSSFRSDNVVRLAFQVDQGKDTNSNSTEPNDSERQIGSPCDFIVPRPRFRHGSRIGDIYGGILVIVGAFLGFGLIAPVAGLLWRDRRSRLGWLLAAIAAIVLFLTIGSGAIGCLPGSWHKCLCDGQDHSEYRQTFEHDGGNVPHGAKGVVLND
jgi:hypothetical protein